MFKELEKPSFFIAHGGMPNVYDGKHSNRTDYSIQWGKKQKEGFEKMGFSPSKLYVAGHPVYNKIPNNLRFDFSNILILTKSISGVSPLDEPHIDDPGNAILYLFSIKEILEKLHIHKVHLRPHPSEDYSWYSKHIDTSFFVENSRDIATSLKSSTLVIGPISTTFSDAMYYGVNYITYEPLINGHTVMGRPITPPMDGKDPRIPMAFNEDELYKLLINKKKIDLSVCPEFVKTPRDISFIQDLIGKD